MDQHKFDKTAELLYATKLNEIRQEVNTLQRHFNVVGYTASTVEDSSRELCIFSPSIANIQEVCLILNPIYNELLTEVFEVLIRASFTILNHKVVEEIADYQAEDLFGSKYGFAADGQLVFSLVTGRPLNVFHIAKIAGDREIRAVFQQSDL